MMSINTACSRVFEVMKTSRLEKMAGPMWHFFRTFRELFVLSLQFAIEGANRKVVAQVVGRMAASCIFFGEEGCWTQSREPTRRHVLQSPVEIP
jgi:hypothetical protein